MHFIISKSGFFKVPQNWDALLFFGGAAFDLSFTDMFHYVNTVGKDPSRLLGATAIISPSMLHFGIGRMYAGYTLEVVLGDAVRCFQGI